MRVSVRNLLTLYALALSAVAVATLLVLGLPWAVRGGIRPGVLGAVAAVTGAAVLLAAVALLFRGIARPIDRLLDAAARLGPRQAAPAGDLPILGDPVGGRAAALERAAIAFERLMEALESERVRLAAKVDELTESNRALAEARESLVRTEKLATVGRLASGLAHEVGNPLGAVKGYLDLARTRLPPAPNPELVEALDRIGAAAERIDRTLRELLDFARPTAPVLAPIEVSRVIDASVRLARVQARFKHVEVDVQLAPGLARVVADEHHLAQVLLNLLLNAGDATRGSGHVRITGAMGEAGRVTLTVEDDGPGFRAADLPRIFDPFFTTKDPGAGTGLGLAISHRIMESFGGEILASNGERGGARFELRFRAAAGTTA